MVPRAGPVALSLAVAIGVALFLLGVLLFALVFLAIGGYVAVLLGLDR